VLAILTMRARAGITILSPALETLADWTQEGNLTIMASYSTTTTETTEFAFGASWPPLTLHGAGAHVNASRVQVYSPRTLSLGRPATCLSRLLQLAQLLVRNGLGSFSFSSLSFCSLPPLMHPEPNIQAS
jgi:hypothetical protein